MTELGLEHFSSPLSLSLPAVTVIFLSVTHLRAMSSSLALQRKKCVAEVAFPELIVFDWSVVLSVIVVHPLCAHLCILYYEA